MTSLYASIPKDLTANLEYRRSLLSVAGRSKDAAKDLWIASSRDLLFYVNAFCWTYDPRQKNGSIPFITYEFQDELMMDLVDRIENGGDLIISKSRDMGASWCILTVYEWLWHFRSDLSFFVGQQKRGLR